MPNKILYTEEDLQAAFKAGEDLVNQEWHNNEFCCIGCKCKPLQYHEFEAWKKITFKLNTNEKLSRS